MFLRMISVEKVKRLVTPYDNQPFRWTCHHVKEIFLSSLPKKFCLDGSSAVQLRCGPNTEKLQFLQVSGVTIYRIPDFDFAGYYALKPHGRETFMLQFLQDKFFDIIEWNVAAADREVKKEAVRQAAGKVEACGFRMKIPIKKLSRTVPSTPLKLQIYRVLSYEDGESWCCEVVRNRTEVLCSQWMGKHPEYLYGSSLYFKSEIEGGVFRVFDNLRVPTYELDLTKFS